MATQAKALRTSVSYISAIERGTRPIPEEYPDAVANWLELSETDSRELQELAQGRRRFVKIYPADPERAVIATQFADVVNTLSLEQLRQFRKLLSANGRPTSFSETQLRRLAMLARVCFEVGSALSFDVLSILENRLSEIDPQFSLQVEPNDDLGNNVAAYAAAVRKIVQKIVLSEHAYNAVSEQTEVGRFIGAHELAHWLLHPNRTEFTPFRRYRARRNRLEDEADYFARLFLMPDEIAQRFKSPNSLAAACNVPREQAEKRLRELGLWPLSAERERISDKFSELLADLKGESVHALETQITPAEQKDQTKTGSILQFPNNHRRPKSKLFHNRKRKRIELPLFDYAFTNSRNSIAPQHHISEFDLMLEALGHYSGHHYDAKCSSPIELVHGKNMRKVNILDRGLEWYREYGWRC